MAQPSDEIRAKLEQQKQDFMQLALLNQRQKQAALNAEAMANKKAKGSITHAHHLEIEERPL